MRINPVSTVPFKSAMFGLDTSKVTLDGVTKTMSNVTTLATEGKEFSENVKKDEVAYADAFVNLADKAEESKVLKPIAKAADTKTGKAVTSAAGKFIAWCTGLAGAASTVTMGK